MRYAQIKKKTCESCRYRQKLGAIHYCDYIGMTGESRVKLGITSEEVGEACPGHAPRNPEEQRKMVEERRRGVFNASIVEALPEPGRTVRELSKLKARAELQAADRNDVAAALGMSARAAEALYGGGRRNEQ